MNKILQIVLVSFLLVGCAGPIKQSWYDFTAYYNTFYNAKQFYNEGYRLNVNQQPEINPAIPIRIHETPTAAGQDQFQEAIDRGASILRNHEKSKFVNPALFLIGRSYFYRTEYFSALEKFQELRQIASGKELQQAILWQGRTLLEMNSTNQGIRFLELEIDYVDDWESELLAQSYAMLAQLYTQQEDWNTASEYLHLSEGLLEDRSTRAKAFFLHGQILERLNLNNQALAAYGYAAESKPVYDLEFNALRKQAEMNRELGNYDTALQLYRNLERDDKYFENRVEIRFELARTYQKKGDSNQSVQLYKNILANRFESPDNNIRAFTYFSLGEIFRDDYSDFTMAAAYFDSASTIQVDDLRFEERFNASDLAASFGEYASIKREINHADSLLYLAGLEPEELDSVLIVVSQRMQEELDRETDRNVTTQRVVNEGEEVIVDATESLENGFLNVRNQTLMRDASLQFQAVWGDRPLADNWRRRSEVSGSRFDQIVLSDEETEVDQVLLQEDERMTVSGPDISQIPFTEQQKIEVKTNRENLEYRLANLFMIALDMPDSAKIYYENVIESGLDDSLAPRSLYSLTELELSDGNTNQAEVWSDMLITRFPESFYAEEIAERTGRSEDILTRIDHMMTTEERYINIVNSDTLKDPLELAIQLQNLAYESTSDQQKPILLFDSAKMYLEAAIQRSEDQNVLTNWIQMKQEMEEDRDRFSALQDSASVKLENNSDLTEEEIQHWQAIADSTFEETIITAEFPFEGEYWDSTRSVLEQIETNFSSSSVIRSVQQLREIIEKPNELETETGFITEEFPRDRFPTEPVPEQNSCFDLGLELKMDGGIEAFVQLVNYPDWTRDINMRGEITFRVDVTQNGEVESYEQVSRMDRTGIPQSFEEAIERELKFKPHSEEQSIRCEITFPIEI